MSDIKPGAAISIGLDSSSTIVNHKIKAKVVVAGQLTDPEHETIKDLIVKSGTIKPDAVDERIKRAELVVLAKHDGHTHGCLALRTNKSTYMQKLIGRSRVSGLPHESLELSWLRVKQSKLNQGVEKLMFDALVSAKNASTEFGQRKIFAVYRTDDVYSNSMLESFGFVKHDRDHEALVGDGKRVQLWLLP